MEVDAPPAPPLTTTTATKTVPMPANFQQPWVEKYRPKVLSDVVGNEETTTRLSAIASDGNLPNLIISGPPGTGKTTSVHALARQLLGEAGYKAGVLELNASDSRGIDVVRNKIKMFAQSKVTLPMNRHKVVILDEADSMTTAAQQALRRTMEIYCEYWKRTERTATSRALLLAPLVPCLPPRPLLVPSSASRVWPLPHRGCGRIHIARLVHLFMHLC